MVAIRWLVTFVCIVVIGVAVVVPALGAGPGGAPPKAAFAGSDPDFGAGLGRVVQRRERLRTADAKSERQRSRTRYRDASRAEALDAGQRAFPDEFTSRVFRGGEPSPGLRTVRTLGRGTGVVQDDAGRRLLLASSLPLESKNAAGDERPVDLALTESATAFESVNPLVDVRVAKRSRGGIAFGDNDTFKIVPGSDGDVAGSEQSDRVFFSNALTDTDVLVAPRPGRRRDRLAAALRRQPRAIGAQRRSARRGDLAPRAHQEADPR